MTLPLTGARLEVYDPGQDDRIEDDPKDILHTQRFTSIDASTFEITQRIGIEKDTATFHFDNTDGDLTHLIESGEKLYFEAPYGTDRQTTDAYYGEEPYGGAAYGGALNVATARRWLGYAHAPNFTHLGAGFTAATFNATDFVYELLSSRKAYIAYDERQVSGTEDSIVNELLRIYAPEIDQSWIEPIEKESSFEFNGIDLLEALGEVASVADAIVYSNNESLVWEPLDFERTEFDLTYDDMYLGTLDWDDSELTNDVRVDGASGHAIDETTEPDIEGDYEPENYYRVTEDDHLYLRLDPEKTRLDRCAVWIRRGPHDEDFRVGIQRANDTDTGPRSPDNDAAMVVSSTSPADFLTADGWRTGLRFANEPLPDQPWLILKSAGETGHDVGLNDNDDPLVRTYYPHPIFVRQRNEASIDHYRQRQSRRKMDTISSFQAADDAAAAILRHNAIPTKELAFEAHSFAAHQVGVSTIINVDFPALGAHGPYLVTERSDTYDISRNELRTEFTAVDLESV